MVGRYLCLDMSAQLLGQLYHADGVPGADMLDIDEGTGVQGHLSAGADADLVLFDPNEKWTVKEFKSKATNSPFIGEELYGKVKYTICGGKIAYQE